MTSIPITLDQAAEALRNAATPAGTVHELCFTARGEILSRHEDVEGLVDSLQYALGGCIAFEPGPFGHDLAVLMNGVIFRYAVPMPQESGAEMFLTQYGGIIADLLARVEDPFAASISRNLRIYGARQGWPEQEVTAADFKEALDILTEYGAFVRNILEEVVDDPTRTRDLRTRAEQAMTALGHFLGFTEEG